MCFIFQFSKYVAIPILTEWLDNTDLMTFDTATCNYEERFIFLKWCSEHVLLFQKAIFESVSEVPLSVDIFEWCLSRVFDLSWIYSGMVLKTFQSFQKIKNVAVICNIMHYLPKVKHLVVEVDAKGQVGKFLNLFFSKFTGLEGLKFGKVWPNALSVISVACNNLTACDLSNNAGISTQIVALCHNCPLLRSLDISNCGNIGVILPSIGVHGIHLEYLNIERCEPILTRDLLLFGMHRQCMLKELMYYNEWISITSRCFVLRKSQQLQVIDYSCCNTIDNQTIIDISRNCSSLTSLNLSHCSRITDESIVLLVQQCPGLQSLSLDELSVTDESLLAITHCMELKQLDLLLSMFTVEGLKSIARCSNLTCLSLNQQYALTDDVLTQIVAQINGLRLLYLTNDFDLSIGLLTMLTDASLYSIAKYCYQTLTTFELSHCPGVTDDGVCTLVDACTLLTSIRIFSCKLVTIPPFDKQDEDDNSL